MNRVLWVVLLVAITVWSCGGSGGDDGGGGNKDGGITVPSSYEGHATIGIIYVDAETGEAFDSITYSHDIVVDIEPPKAIELNDLRETNPFSIEIFTLPLGPQYDYYGQAFICSAITSSLTTIPGMSPNSLFQFWTIKGEGNTISGIVTDAHRDYVYIPFANHIKFEPLTIFTIYGGLLDEGSTLSGRVASDHLDIEVEGSLVPIHPAYYCEFYCDIKGTRK